MTEFKAGFRYGGRDTRADVVVAVRSKCRVQGRKHSLAPYSSDQSRATRVSSQVGLSTRRSHAVVPIRLDCLWAASMPIV